MATELRRMTTDAARRVALAAQGLAGPRPAGRITKRHLHKVFDTIGIVQIDSVNVLVRTQELPLFARLGPHPRTLIPDALEAGELFETWAHAASILPARDLALVRWRMEQSAAGEGWQRIGRRPDVLAGIEAQIRERGALTVGDFEGRVRNKGTWWDWDETKLGVERLFEIGVLGATRRRNDFARRYDLLERLLPPEVHAAPALGEHEARKESLRRAARHLGVATFKDLADYYRINPTRSRPALRELVDAGDLIPVAVEGWKDEAYLHPDATTPRAASATTLLSPFDSLVWNRDRTARLFDFDYRLEIYVPAPKRLYGYYVLPFLLDGQLVGRVDLKADRAEGVLRVQAAHIEPDLDTAADRPMVAEALIGELQLMAGWLGLGHVAAVRRGTLAAELHRHGLDEIAAAPAR